MQTMSISLGGRGQNFESTLWVLFIQKNEFFGGYEDFVVILRGHRKT